MQWSNYRLDATGRILYVEATITLREWYEGIELDMGWYTPPQADGSGLMGGDIFASGASNTDIIWSFLRMNGFSAAATAGIMGNWERESGNNPDITEIGGYGGYGLAQWTNTGSGSAARKTNLINWCNSNGYDYRTLEGQLNYFLYEYNLPYYSQNLGASYKAITDVWTATDRFLTYFEGCTVRNSVVAWDVRINAANKYYNMYKDYVQVPSTIVSTGGFGGGAAGDGMTTGSWLWPCPDSPGCGILMYDNNNYGHTHNAGDFQVSVGNRIVAMDGGNVDWVQYWDGYSKWGNQSYGNCVRIRHSNGYTTLYAHLSQISVGTGPVSRGQLLGLSGNTGNSTGPHCHIECYPQGAGQYQGIFPGNINWSYS